LELKKIEARKKERERKTQDLQKLISQADSQSETPRKTDKKLPKKKLTNPSRPSRVDTSVSTIPLFKISLQSIFVITLRKTTFLYVPIEISFIVSAKTPTSNQFKILKKFRNDCVSL
jgi:hypothetical protein